VVLAAGLTDTNATAARLAHDRLRQWVQQRDVVEFLEQLTLLAVPYRQDGPPPPGGRGGRGRPPQPVAAVARAPGWTRGGGGETHSERGSGGQGGQQNSAAPLPNASSEYGVVQQIAELPLITELIAAGAAMSLEVANEGGSAGTGGSGGGVSGGGAGPRTSLTAAAIVGTAIGAALGVVVIAAAISAAAVRHHRRKMDSSVRSSSGSDSSRATGFRRGSRVVSFFLASVTAGRRSSTAASATGQPPNEPGAGLSIVATRNTGGVGASDSRVSVASIGWLIGCFALGEFGGGSVSSHALSSHMPPP